MIAVPLGVIVGIILLAVAAYIAIAIILATPYMPEPRRPFQASCVREIPGVFDWRKAAGE